MNRFTDRVVVVTGAASGIGAAAARRFASEGAKVVLVDVSPTGSEVASAIGGLFVRADVSSKSAWVEIAERTHEFGPADILFSNAYRHIAGAPHELAGADWDAVLGVNLTGLFLGVSTFTEDLRRTRGAIVATSSVHSRFGLPGYSAYAASKGAIESLCRQLSVELAPDIRVNCVVPGPVMTGAWADDDRAGIERAAAATAVGRLGTADEVAAAVAFLASDEASFITGASLVVDGGWSVAKDSL